MQVVVFDFGESFEKASPKPDSEVKLPAELAIRALAAEVATPTSEECSSTFRPSALQIDLSSQDPHLLANIGARVLTLLRKTTGRLRSTVVRKTTGRLGSVHGGKGQRDHCTCLSCPGQ